MLVSCEAAGKVVNGGASTDYIERAGERKRHLRSASQFVGRKIQQCFGLRFCAPAATDAINFANA